MNVGDAGNSANANSQADDRANNSMDGDHTPNTTDIMDANVLDIITRIQTNELLDLESNGPDPEQIPSAELESPPEDLANPVEPSSVHTHPEEVVERFAHGKPGAPMDGLQGCSIYDSSREGLGGTIWAPFQSEIEWDFAHWAKLNRLSSSALADLLAIPDVRPFFFFITPLLNVVKGCREARPLLSYCKGSQFNHRRFAWPPTIPDAGHPCRTRNPSISFLGHLALYPLDLWKS